MAQRMRLAALCLASLFVGCGAKERTAREMVSGYLTHVQNGDWAGAWNVKSGGGSIPGTAEAMQVCLESTVLTRMSSQTCEDADVDGNRAWVHCSLRTESGTFDMSMSASGLNSDTPYLGALLFADPTAYEPLWASDSCSLFSGRGLRIELPEGRHRPR